MDIKVVLFDNRQNQEFDISQAVGDIQITTHIRETPGKCTFFVLKGHGLAFWEGAQVKVSVSGVSMFSGYVFTKKRDKDVNLIHVTCYDQLRYLQNKDSRAFVGKTASAIFTELCNDFVLKHKVVHSSSHLCAPRNEDNQTLYTMIQNAMDDTFINTGQWLFIRDNFGTLEMRDVNQSYSGFMLGDNSGVTDLDYQTSIDKDVYNVIKLYRDNEETGKRELFEVNSTVLGGDTLVWWGILQLYEKINEDYNIAQIESRAMNMLRYYNSTRRTLTLECLGVKELYAGCTIKCSIANLGDLSINDYLLVTDCTHNITNKKHTMQLKMELVRRV